MSLRSVIFRLPKAQRDALRVLARETRIRQSEYLREAIDDVLAKHAAKLEPEATP